MADAITSHRNTVYVSAVNTWELAIKAGLGRVHLPFADLQATIEQAGFAELPVGIAHALRLRDLPRLHRDPFDRLLVAPAIDESLTLVSGNAACASYPVQLFWA